MLHLSKKNHTLLNQFGMNLITYSGYACIVLDCEKQPYLCKFLDEPDTPLDIQMPPSWIQTSTMLLFIPSVVGEEH